MRKFFGSFTALNLLVLIVAFQNCAQNNFAGDAQSNEKESGNGGNYDGKISYVVTDVENLCGDGSLIRSRIDHANQTFFLVKENCTVITPKTLEPASVSVDATGFFLTYSGTIYTKSRDPWLQPFHSASFWNTSVGSGALWSLSSDAETLDLQTAGFGINAGQWSTPYYLAKTTDSVRAVTSPNLPAQNLNFGSDFQLSAPSNGNNVFVMMDSTKRWLYHFAGCKFTSTGINCNYGAQDDSCGDGLGGFDLGRGLMRTWEIQAGKIEHVLRFALPTNINKPSGTVWPAEPADYTQGLPGSTGHIAYGSTVGIPSNVDLNLLGLTAGGKILAKALQNYGAVQRDSSGSSGGIIFFAEQGAETLPQLAEMRSDLAKIVPYLRVMKNQGPSSINGGGTRALPTLPSLDPNVCK